MNHDDPLRETLRAWRFEPKQEKQNATSLPLSETVSLVSHLA
jgi:hypothetical protein